MELASPYGVIAGELSKSLTNCESEAFGRVSFVIELDSKVELALKVWLLAPRA